MTTEEAFDEARAEILDLDDAMKTARDIRDDLASADCCETIEGLKENVRLATEKCVELLKELKESMKILKNY